MSAMGFLEKRRTLLSKFVAAVVGCVFLFSEGRWSDTSPVSAIAFAAGVFLAGISAFGRLWCGVYIAGYKDNTLVTMGPYSMCRHPLYFFSMLGAVGVGLTTETLLIPTVILLGFALYYPAVIRREDARLAAVHGEAFQPYMKETNAFFPKWSALKEPAEYTVQPKKLRRNAMDALWFIWLIAVVEAVEFLHHAGLVPVYIRFY